MPAENQILREKMRALRKRLGKTQQQMASLCGMSLSGYRRLEGKGRTGFQTGKLQALAKSMGIAETAVMVEIGTLAVSDNIDQTPLAAEDLAAVKRKRLKGSGYARVLRVPIRNFIMARRIIEETGLWYPPTIMDGYVLDPGLDDPKAAAFVLEDNGMEPEGRRGDVVLVRPSEPLAMGDRVVIDLGRSGGIVLRSLVSVGPPMRVADLDGNAMTLVKGQAKLEGKMMWLVSRPGSKPPHWQAREPG